jgi:RNA polymerase sigma-70 factor (ECF subfamily)
VYTGYIKACLHRFGVNESDIEDVTQDVVIKVAGAVKRFEFRSERGGFRSWLKTVARNRAVDHIRQRPPRLSGFPLEALSATPSQEVEEREFDQSVSEVEDLYTRATLELSNYFQRESVEIFLSLVRGASVSQIATEKGKSEAAIRQTKVRVLKKLREIAGE